MQNKTNPNFPVTGGDGARVNRDDLLARMRKARQKPANPGRIRMPTNRAAALKQFLGRG